MVYREDNVFFAHNERSAAVILAYAALAFLILRFVILRYSSFAFLLPSEHTYIQLTPTLLSTNISFPFHSLQSLT